MYNAEKPAAEDLPDTARLLKSTAIAAAAAAAILTTVVIPAEYAVDPTGAGRLLGLTEMGEIKSQLADEAEQDRLNAVGGEQSSLLDNVLGLLVGTAHAQTAPVWRDVVSFTLSPGEGIEWKVVMQEGEETRYSWFVEDGVVNFDMHGDGGGNAISYEKGRGVPGAEGVLTAAFTGNHGWFWRNRDSQDIIVTVQLTGDYSELKQAN